jgi:mono/diheme cytochrome c family protein
MPRLAHPRLLACLLLAGLLLATATWTAGCAPAPLPPAGPPPRLADTGLYADFAARRLAAEVLSYAPQYPLWTDGAAKDRWISLPPGTAIDGSDPDHWEFPIGTRLWKEFRFDRPIETRFMQRRADGSWLYATYHWTDDGSDAVLAPETGVVNACATSEGRHHDLPSLADCRLCHEGTRTPVLGFSALQLSPDRDPLAPHGAPARQGDVDLNSLAARGLLRGFPARWLETPPKIAAKSARERAALGYLHGNCSNCHNGTGPLQRLGLRLDQPLAAGAAMPALATTVGVASRFTRPEATERIAGGAPQRSVLVHRLAASDPLTQMPPFGRHLTDRDALALVEAWIAHDLAPTSKVDDDLTTASKH